MNFHPSFPVRLSHSETFKNLLEKTLKLQQFVEELNQLDESICVFCEKTTRGQQEQEFLLQMKLEENSVDQILTEFKYLEKGYQIKLSPEMLLKIKEVFISTLTEFKKIYPREAQVFSNQQKVNLNPEFCIKQLLKTIQSHNNIPLNNPTNDPMRQFCNSLYKLLVTEETKKASVQSKNNFELEIDYTICYCLNVVKTFIEKEEKAKTIEIMAVLSLLIFSEFEWHNGAVLWDSTYNMILSGNLDVIKREFDSTVLMINMLIYNNYTINRKENDKIIEIFKGKNLFEEFGRQIKVLSSQKLLDNFLNLLNRLYHENNGNTHSIIKEVCSKYGLTDCSNFKDVTTLLEHTLEDIEKALKSRNLNTLQNFNKALSSNIRAQMERSPDIKSELKSFYILLLKCSFLLDRAATDEKPDLIRSTLFYMQTMISGFNLTLGILIDLQDIHNQLTKRYEGVKSLQEIQNSSDLEKIIERIEDLETLFGHETISNFMRRIQNEKHYLGDTLKKIKETYMKVIFLTQSSDNLGVVLNELGAIGGLIEECILFCFKDISCNNGCHHNTTQPRAPNSNLINLCNSVTNISIANESAIKPPKNIKSDSSTANEISLNLGLWAQKTSKVSNSGEQFSKSINIDAPSELKAISWNKGDESMLERGDLSFLNKTNENERTEFKAYCDSVVKISESKELTLLENEKNEVSIRENIRENNRGIKDRQGGRASSKNNCLKENSASRGAVPKKCGEKPKAGNDSFSSTGSFCQKSSIRENSFYDYGSISNYNVKNRVKIQAASKKENTPPVNCSSNLFEKPMENWSCSEVEKFLGTWGFSRVSKDFKTKGIDGAQLKKLNYKDLSSIVRGLEMRKKIELLYYISKSSMNDKFDKKIKGKN